MCGLCSHHLCKVSITPIFPRRKPGFLEGHQLAQVLNSRAYCKPMLLWCQCSVHPTEGENQGTIFWLPFSAGKMEGSGALSLLCLFSHHLPPWRMRAKYLWNIYMPMWEDELYLTVRDMGALLCGWDESLIKQVDWSYFPTCMKTMPSAKTAYSSPWCSLYFNSTGAAGYLLSE